MVVSSHEDKATLKFLCSYGGKILPRHPDGKLRYLGGHTRVLALPRSTPFSEVLVKLEELCGSHVIHFRCQLPSEDLDALVSITSDEDLANLIEEYDNVSSLKIRAFLFSSPALSKSSSSSSSSSFSSSSSSSTLSFRYPTYTAVPPAGISQVSPTTAAKKYAGTETNVSLPCCGYRVQGKRGVVYLIRNGNHWH